MKALIAAIAVAAVPALAMAQAAPAAPADKPAAKTAAKPVAKKKSGKLAPSAQKTVEEKKKVKEDEPGVKLSASQLEIAKHVSVGDISCEMGATVRVTPMKREGFFLVSTKGHQFRMHPVESRTGAIRLEDPKRGALWLQLANKSMLMSQKLGQRLADECKSPEQAAVAESLKKNPQPGLLN